MKVTEEHFNHIKSAVEPLDTAERRQRAIAEGHSDKRYRWDLLWATGLSRWICDTLYKYCCDTHIDTALRNIVKPLERDSHDAH